MDEPEQSRLRRVGEVAARVGGGQPRHPRLRFAVQLALGALIFAFLVFAVVSQWSELQEQDVKVDLVWVAPALGVFLVLYACAAFGWDLVLRALGHWLRPARAQMAWAQSLLARYVPGGVLMIVGRVLLAEREGVPRRTTLASMVYEQGLMVVAAILVGSWALAGSRELGSEAGRLAFLALAPVLLLVMHPRIFGPLANRALRIFGREPLPALLPLRRLLTLLAYYLLVWAIFGLGALFAARTVYEVGASDFAALMAAQALGYSVALLAFIFPGGLGIRDGTFALVLDAALPGGFALAAAIAIAVRLLTTLAEVIYAGGATLIGRRSPTPPQPLREAT